ncbi:metallophosphoesterase [Kosakonia sp. SMBL-WEM22]|uniref:metallophosphoesterase n=1 Tax=Kosakonia sp. SMBL-WEM22 TaxID=2725560 RepID=UPI0016597A5D|nr:metallophosphoesterase [Kosakonia sp. SMBL-WEM22]QNQ20366.1 metallophosphoesterase [Kosakonia sp. SMBL-WEM22]
MRIAQLSDIHAAADNDNLARLRTAIAWLLAFPPDIVVVSGDLADDGWAQGYRDIAAQLSRLPCRSLLLAGNADDKAVMCASMPQLAASSADKPLHFNETLEGVSLVGVDVTVAGKSGGDITPHLPWLELTLREAGHLVMLFMHQHLFPSGIAPLDAAMCEGGAALAALIERLPHPPLAICCGHVHRAMASTFAGVAAYCCGSICPANPLLLNESAPPPITDPAALMLHDIRPQGRVSHFIGV